MASTQINSVSKLFSGINFTPLMDVVLMLLLAFAVTYPFLGKPLTSSQAETVAAHSPQKPGKPAGASIQASKVPLAKKDLVIDTLDNQFRTVTQ